MLFGFTLKKSVWLITHTGWREHDGGLSKECESLVLSCLIIFEKEVVS